MLSQRPLPSDRSNHRSGSSLLPLINGIESVHYHAIEIAAVDPHSMRSATSRTWSGTTLNYQHLTLIDSKLHAIGIAGVGRHSNGVRNDSKLPFTNKSLLPCDLQEWISSFISIGYKPNHSHSPESTLNYTINYYHPSDRYRRSGSFPSSSPKLTVNYSHGRTPNAYQ